MENPRTTNYDISKTKAKPFCFISNKYKKFTDPHFVEECHKNPEQLLACEETLAASLYMLTQTAFQSTYISI